MNLKLPTLTHSISTKNKPNQNSTQPRTKLLNPAKPQANPTESKETQPNTLHIQPNLITSKQNQPNPAKPNLNHERS